MQPTVAALIVTRDREDLLVSRAAPAVLRQTRLPEIIVIVDDGGEMRDSTRRALAVCAETRGLDLVMLHNTRTAGAGGAWNTGLAYLASRGHRGFVAILDDDDEWSEHHIATNLACSEGATIVVSGLGLCQAGHPTPRSLIDVLDDRAFLIGNPGWQGSNTFVSLDLLIQTGGFREGLLSLNDRDIAIRLLRHPDAVWRLTGRWTATWHADTPGNLSTPRSEAKRLGLRAFWRIYGDEMSPGERNAFFLRAEQFFGFGAPEIIGGRPESISPPGLVRSARNA
jgi:glycosyltransferase involved in cell wall biosynthesis